MGRRERVFSLGDVLEGSATDWPFQRDFDASWSMGCPASSLHLNVQMRLLIATSALLLAGTAQKVLAGLGSFHEELTLHPLPDGSLSVSFDFSTYFDGSSGCKSRMHRWDPLADLSRP